MQDRTEGSLREDFSHAYSIHCSNPAYICLEMSEHVSDLYENIATIGCLSLVPTSVLGLTNCLS